MRVLHGPRRLFCRKEPAATARARRQEDRACRRAGLPRSERLHPLRGDQARGLWRVVRRLLNEETTLRAQPERARFPTLCVLSTSAAFQGGGALFTSNSYPLTVAAKRLSGLPAAAQVRPGHQCQASKSARPNRAASIRRVCNGRRPSTSMHRTRWWSPRVSSACYSSRQPVIGPNLLTRLGRSR